MTRSRSNLRELPGVEAALSGVEENDRLQLATRVAWMYFVEGLRQEDVAAALGISRMRVNRLVAMAHEEGLVRIEIVSPHRAACELEAQLRQAFGLREAIVVQAPQDPEQLVDCVGHALGSLLNRRLSDGMTVGVHHGRSTYAMFRGLRPASMPNLATVSLKGSLSPLGRIVPQETVARLALTLEASGYQLAAPSYARSVKERELFMGLPIVQAVLERARACDVAVLTASRATDNGGLVGNGFISPQEAAELRDAGAVGAVLGVFVDEAGEVVDHDVNRRRIGLELGDLAAVPDVILSGAGREKAPALRAALRRGFTGSLVTDEATARDILAS
jgi:DNA-binding transcriptional regulator LsrR (DeoR family)